jgi:uncharacterized protein with PIN domain
LTLLDAFALVAFLTDEPAASEVEELLDSGATAMTTVNLAEAIDVVARGRKRDPHELRTFTAHLFVDLVDLLAPDEDDAWRAAAIRSKHYRRRVRALSIADCFLLACALNGDHTIATSDPAVVATAREERVPFISLPDSAGERP